MPEVIPLKTEQGSFLATLSLYRMPDGTIRASLREMPVHVIESEETIPARFYRLAKWTFLASRDLLRQGRSFEEPSS